MKEKDHESYLLHILAKGAYTRRSLEERLARRGAESDEISTLLDYFEDLGYVDDALYARLYVESHEERGSLRLRSELRRRGVAEALIEEALSKRDEASEEEAALNLAREWVEAGVEARLIAGRLIRRGFPPSLVRSVLERLERKTP